MLRELDKLCATLCCLITACVVSNASTSSGAASENESATNPEPRLLAQGRRAVGLVQDACKDISNQQLDAAIEKLNEALRIQPGYRLALENLAVAYTNKAWLVYGQENWSEAAVVLQRAIDTTKLARGPHADVRKLQQCSDFCLQTLKDQRAQQKIIESLAGEPNNYLADVSPVKWPKTRMPLRVYIEPGTGVPFHRPEFDKQLMQACAVWTEASGGSITFAASADRKRSDIEVVWSNKRTEAIAATEAGHTRIFEDGRGITRATIKLFTVPPPTTPSPITEDSMHVACLHELGHALGIQGHSKDPRDIMAPSFKYIRSASGVTIGLSQRDCNTIAALYCPQPKVPPTSQSSPGATGPKNSSPQGAPSTTSEIPEPSPEPIAPPPRVSTATVQRPAKPLPEVDLPTTETKPSKPVPRPAASNEEVAETDRRVVMLNNEAASFLKDGRFAEALGRLFIAGKLKPSSKLTNQNLALARYNWALQLSREGKYEAAEQQITESLRIRDTMNQQNSPQYGAGLQCYLYCLQKMNKPENSEQIRHVQNAIESNRAARAQDIRENNGAQ